MALAAFAFKIHETLICCNLLSPWNRNSNDALQLSRNVFSADFEGISLEIHHKVIFDCAVCAF